jgi:hypothetical protein
VAAVRNAKAIGALVFGVLALGFLAAGAAVPRFVDTVEPLEALVVVPAAVVCALISIGLARRARFDFQRTLGRIGGDGIAVAARALSVAALVISLTAALAVGVFAVLALVLG